MRELEGKDLVAVVALAGAFICKALGVNSTVDDAIIIVLTSYFTYEFAVKPRINK